jgi:hypothetical protein
MAHTPFTGNIFIFQAFDVGDDINLERVKENQLMIRRPTASSKYFKNYHIPLSVELPHPHTSSRCNNVKLHNFGSITLRYQIPFNMTFEDLSTQLNHIDSTFNEQSVEDANIIFKRIKSAIKQPRFFHLRRSYVVIQVDPQHATDTTDIVELKEKYGSFIASMLRFEAETLSEYQKNEILDNALGYYRGDLIVIDTEASFVYDDEYDDILDLFEFANMQQLELHYFDKVLDQQLNTVYEREVRTAPWKSYLPFIGAALNDPVGELGKLRVDISVITERLENSIKLAGEAYYAELYSLLSEKLALKNWKESINNKLAIIHDISSVYQSKIDARRDDLLSILVILLIFFELLVALFK